MGRAGQKVTSSTGPCLGWALPAFSTPQASHRHMQLPEGKG